MATLTISRALSKLSGARSGSKAFKRALELFRSAAARVPAYKDFLQKNHIEADSIQTKEDFAELPLLNKENYITQYSLPDMSWDGSLAADKYISSSSGSTGVPFYWPRGAVQDAVVGGIFKRVYEDMFGTKTGSTLCVDSFALGTWIAGFELFNATSFTADCGSNLVLVTPSIDKQMAIEQIQKLRSSFDRVVIAGYPPFVKDILEEGIQNGVDWKRWDVRLLTGGEAISERWRDYVLAAIGKSGSVVNVINMYGMAEAGIVAHETPLSVLSMRAVCETKDLYETFPHFADICGLYQYDPNARFFEVAGEDSLILTADTGIPLVRYETRDRGGIIEHAEMLKLIGAGLTQRATSHGVDPAAWQSPFIYLFGRKDLSISLYALNIYVENVKQALETSPASSKFSGLFTMEIGHTQTLDQRFDITVELARGEAPSAALGQMLTDHVVHVLCKVNMEYAKLYEMLGARAIPNIKLVPYGEIETVRGRKHKWVKR